MNQTPAPGMPSPAELKAMDEFVSSLRKGRAPSVDQHLARYPEFEGSLRPVLEGAKLFDREYRLLQARYPGISLCKLFGLKA